MHIWCVIPHLVMNSFNDLVEGPLLSFIGKCLCGPKDIKLHWVRKSLFQSYCTTRWLQVIRRCIIDNSWREAIWLSSATQEKRGCEVTHMLSRSVCHPTTAVSHWIPGRNPVNVIHEQVAICSRALRGLLGGQEGTQMQGGIHTLGKHGLPTDVLLG